MRVCRAVCVVWLTSMGCEPLSSYRGLDGADGGGQASGGSLAAIPTWLDFGTISAGGLPATRTLELVNTGDAAVSVFGHDQPVGLFDDNASVFSVESDGVLELEPGESVRLPVEFAPPTDGRWEAQLTIAPGPVPVDLLGRGRAPVVGADGPAGVVAAVGCESTATVEVFNQGSARLELSDLTLSDPWDVWSLAADPTPAFIEPGDRLRVRYRFSPAYDPSGGGLRQATTRLHTDDPRQPVLDVALEGLALDTEGVVESFTYQPTAAIDMLVVADTDGVMGLQIPGVQAAMPRLVDAFADAGVSLQAAVVTGDSACPTTSPPFAVPTDERALLLDVLESGLDGPFGPGSDRLGDHAVQALDQAAGGCLQGLIREDAFLHVVLVAGDEDRSAASPATQLARIRAAAPAAAATRVSAVLPTDSLGCDGTVYSASYAGIAAAAGGAVIDLCADNLGDWLPLIATAALQDAAEPLAHTLAVEPIAESIAVTVDGEPWGAYRYDAASRTVLFDAASPPRAGASVSVTYRAIDDCGL